MLDIGDRAIGVETGEVLLNSLELRGKSNEHDEGALAVADVVDLLLSHSVYIPKGSWQIVFCHIMEGEIPEVKHNWAERFMTVPVPPRVTHPDIESLICEVEGWG